MPPTRLPTTGRARQKASTITRPIPSERDGSTSSVDSSSAEATPLCVRRSVQLVCAGRSRDELLDDRLQRPGADDVQPRVGDAWRGPPPRLGQPVHVLVALEHADEERLRTRRDRLRLLLRKESKSM